LKGLDLGPEICGAGGCDPAFAAFLNDINRHLAADLLSCVPATASAAASNRRPGGNENHTNRRPIIASHGCRTGRCPAGTT
jgi:hypothetical protein